MTAGHASSNVDSRSRGLQIGLDRGNSRVAQRAVQSADMGSVPVGKQSRMTITNALASLAVKDLERAARWYERLLGQGQRPMAEVVEWQFEGGGGLQVYEGPDRAGHGSCTLVVDDIDEIARQLRSSQLSEDVEPTRSDRVDTIMIRDPDGNSIAFAAPKDPTLAQ